MKLYQIYFSPTGGTKKAAGILARAWDCEQEEIDLLDPDLNERSYHFTQEDICIIAVPSFGGRAPQPALKQLEGMKGGGARAVLMAVYGNREFEDTLVELKDTLDTAGFVSAAAMAVVAEHSIMHRFGAGRPDVEDRKELERFGAQVRECLESRNGQGELHIPGNRPYRTYVNVPLKPRADKSCTRCGKCARYCPVQAIPEENPASVDRARCISCMHCVAICPVKARHNNDMLLFFAEKAMKKSCGGRKKNQLFIEKEA